MSLPPWTGYNDVQAVDAGGGQVLVTWGYVAGVPQGLLSFPGTTAAGDAAAIWVAHEQADEIAGDLAADPDRAFESWFDADNAVSTIDGPKIDTKLKFGVPPVLGGTYALDISYLWNHIGTDSSFISRVLMNDQPVVTFESGDLHRQAPIADKGDVSGTGSAGAHGFHHTAMLSLPPDASPTFVLEYGSDVDGARSSMWSASLVLRRVP
jgi:hypothetical protein